MATRIFERDNDAFSVCNINRLVPEIERKSDRHIDILINTTPLIFIRYVETEASVPATPDKKRWESSSGEDDKVSIASRNNFDRLPDEVILNIFQRLPKNALFNAGLVCRRFKRIMVDESLWKRIDASHREIDPDELRDIMRSPVQVLRLVESRINSPKIPEIYLDVPYCLVHLDLTRAAISRRTLTVILSKCINLKRLSLAYLPVTYAVCVALSVRRDLEVLKLSRTCCITADGMDIILTNCLKLKELNLTRSELTLDCINSICENIPSSLEKLYISSCRKLQNFHLKQIVKRCPHLQELDVSFCRLLTLDVVPILQTLNQLRFLNIRGCEIPLDRLLTLEKAKDGVYLNLIDIEQ